MSAGRTGRLLRRTLLVGLSESLCAATAVYAGGVFEITCKNDDCDYKNTVKFGGGFSFKQITGYCARNKTFVYLQWQPYGGDTPAPEPIKVWSPQTGEIVELYKCPKCSDPFFPIKDCKELKHCPGCKRPTAECRLIASYN